MQVGFLALVMFTPQRRWTPWLFGLAVGLIALTRGEGVLLPIVPMAFWWRTVPRREWLKRTAALLVAAVLTIAPWTIRNAAEMHAFVPVSTNSMTTLLVGHNPRANGGRVLPPPSFLARIRKGTPQQQELAEARLARREAIQWALHNPLKELGLIPRKLIALWQPDSDSIRYFLNAPGDRQVGTSGNVVLPVLADVPGDALLFLTIASLIVLGARRLWRSDPAMRAVLAFLALCLVNYGFVYYGQFRYHLPMQPLMILIATPLLMSVWAQRRNLSATAQARGRPLDQSGPDW